MKPPPLLIATSFGDLTHEDDDTIIARIRIKAVTPVGRPDCLLADAFVTSKLWAEPSVESYDELAMHISGIDDINALIVALFNYHGIAVREYGINDVGADHFDFREFLRSDLPSDVAKRLYTLICQALPASCRELTEDHISQKIFNKPSPLHWYPMPGGEHA